MGQLDQHDVQILYSEVVRETDGISFIDHSFQLDNIKYFYPASSVKLPIAILAMEYLNDLPGIDRNSRFQIIEEDSIITTVADEVRKIFVVSDNSAYNRLFELFGQDSIEAKLNRRGIHPIRISHRVSTSNSGRTITRPVKFMLDDSTWIVYDSIVSKDLEKLNFKNIMKGKGGLSGNEILEDPFDFSLKNYYPLTAQQDVLKRVIFPEAFEPKEWFNLTEEQLEYI
ncbi:MAG: serine hydrolase, partial [Ekhidna sp.]|nr:serine hydrolase [Ekhidna sp.]